MKIKAFFLMALFFILSSCGGKTNQQFKVYRLIDHLDNNSIRRSPFTDPANQTESGEDRFPVRSSPLQERGIGDNPFNLKRKVQIWGTAKNAIFSPPDSEYVFFLDLSEYSILEFGTGIIRDANSEKLMESENEKGVNFIITIEINGRKQTIFHKYQPPPKLEKEPTFSSSRHTLKLPYGTKNARLSLVTIGGAQNFSVWDNPVLYNTGQNDKNIILISLDTLRADHLGCYGYERDTSPHIDSLAADSALFVNTYASSPWTLPSHVSLMSSLQGAHHQVYREDDKMDSSIATLADTLRDNSFVCSAITGGGFVSSVYGFSKGFDNYKEESGGIFNQDSSERVYQDISRWIDLNKSKNFFLFIHTYQLHDPYGCPDPYKTMFLDENPKWRSVNLMGYLGGKRAVFKSLPDKERKNIIGLYDGELRYTDETLIGPLIKKLKDMSLYDQTMIILTSDHGEEFSDHGGWGHGHSLYDESLKIPLIIKFPESQYKGQIFENIISHIDIMPTILDSMRLNDFKVELDGRSLEPILKGKEKDDRIFFADIGDNVLNSHIPQKTTINAEKNKLIFNKKFSQEDLDFFLYPPPSLDIIEIFDLSKDPEETLNISSQQMNFARDIIQKINDIYSKAKIRKTEKTEIDQKLKEQFRALGYIK